MAGATSAIRSSKARQMESERYAVRSMCNGQMLRHLSSDFRVSSNSFADQVTWADGLLMSPTGCTVVPPKSWRSGQVLGIAPIDLQEAVKLCEVYFRAC
mmetsp:Transcript_8850/g.10783  ORF Transcript_8850/g.10783 Transcript_8850/m.10783 type:complete len:99 (-) Transcript_8850:257-553(-)